MSRRRIELVSQRDHGRPGNGGDSSWRRTTWRPEPMSWFGDAARSRLWRRKRRESPQKAPSEIRSQHSPIATASADQFIEWAKNWPGLILGSAASGAADFRTAADRHPVLLLIGRESNGLSARLIGLCHRLARIPMAGTTESLNAATATALLLYEVRRTFLGA